MLAGKVAAITGSTTGIGYGIARVLAQKGCSIMLNGFGSTNEIEKVRREISGLNVKVSYSPADMRKPVEIKEFIQQTEKDLGRVDILVGNAGIQYTAPAESYPDEKWEETIAINLSANYHLSQAVLPGMRSRGWGRMIFIASVHGLVASIHKSGYVASKHALVALAREIASENAGKGITCNTICPGWVWTHIAQKQIEANAIAKNISEAQAKQELVSLKQPLPEFITPEDIGELLALLCSDHGRLMNGSVYTMDGGWTAQ